MARRQWGVLTRRQLATIGLSARGIEEMLRTGRLIRLHRAVYA
ncbi:MAG: type IV toxin-antitoxin system AbiEi family antitoxin domain-containing protein [Thermoleophilaceae bacterium]